MGAGFTMGLVLGALLGALTGSLNGFLIASAGGAVLGAWLGRQRAVNGEAQIRDAFAQRFDALERRIAALEERVVESAPVADAHRVATPTEGRVESSTSSSAPAPALAGAPAASAPSPRHDRPPPVPHYGAGARAAAGPAIAASLAEAPMAASRDAGPSIVARAWGWISGGNALTRIGIVILFFGVAFLLRHFAEVANVPIEVKLGAAFVAGLALAGIGLALARGRPAYGVSLQGAGMGVAYLTVFAAFRLYDVLPAEAAIGVLASIAALTVVLALRQNSQALAALASGGGFLAPFLIRVEADPALLFGYVAMVNLVVFALAWRRSWRVLDVLGFGFTFILAWGWGYRYYTPAHYAVVQPFLALFFLFYVAIVVLHARRGTSVRVPLDGVLVFGVPLAGFALQMAIVGDTRYGVAISAVALGAFYALLWFVLRSRSEAVQSLLARAFGAIAIAFLTVAVPFAFDARATSAWWAIEGAAVYWLGTQQRQRAARVFALALQFAAAVAFAWDTPPVGGPLFGNAAFLGSALIGVAALVTAWSADRARDTLSPFERALVPWVLAWGIGWWAFAGVSECREQLDRDRIVAAALAWMAAGAALGLAIARVTGWERIAWMAATLLPSIVVAFVVSMQQSEPMLAGLGALAWPLAWLVHGLGLWHAEGARQGGVERSRHAAGDVLRIAHAATALTLIVWLAVEASDWVALVSLPDTVWGAVAAAWPVILYLGLVTAVRPASSWPLREHRAAYGELAGGVAALLLAGWVAVLSVASPGDPAPLAFVPLANPLEVTLIASLAVLWNWAAAWTRVSARMRAAWLGAGAFLALSGGVARVAHHWAEVPWTISDLAASKGLQAALTLTWTVSAFVLMFVAARRASRPPWMLGAALFAVVIAKLFLVDLAALSGWPRVVAFLGAGLVLMAIGYIAPLPPTAARETAGDRTAALPGEGRQ